MTVRQFIARLAGWTQHGAIDQCPPDVVICLIDCLNSAIQDFFANAPERFKRTTVTHVISPPEQMTLSLSNESTEIGAGPIESRHIGCSLLIDGDNNMAEVASANPPLLASKYAGATGNHEAICYFDTIAITDFDVSRIVTDPRIIDNGVTLLRDDQSLGSIGAERRGTGYSSSGPLQGVQFTSLLSGRRFGDPMRYTIQSTGVSSGDEAVMMIRLDSFPTRRLVVQFDVSIDAFSYKLDAMSDNRNIVVPDQYCRPLLLNLAVGRLAESPFWNEGLDRKLFIGIGESSGQKVKDRVPSNPGRPNNKIRTRRGY